MHRSKKMRDKIELSERDLQWGYYDWGKPVESIKADRALSAGQSVTLKMARQALLLTAETVAKKIGCRVSTYQELETSEANETISLRSMRKAAEAMDCDLVIIVRPKDGKQFLQRLWEPLFAEASKHGWLAKCVPHRKGAALAMICNMIFIRPSFRRAQGWTRNRGERRSWL